MKKILEFYKDLVFRNLYLNQGVENAIYAYYNFILNEFSWDIVVLEEIIQSYINQVVSIEVILRSSFSKEPVSFLRRDHMISAENGLVNYRGQCLIRVGPVHNKDLCHFILGTETYNVLEQLICNFISDSSSYLIEIIPHEDCNQLRISDDQQMTYLGLNSKIT